MKKHFLLFTGSFIALIAGWVLISKRTLATIVPLSVDPVLFWFLVRGVQIGALILLAAVLFKLPIFFELNWRENLKQLFVVVRDRGVPIFHKQFQEAASAAFDEDLAAAGMVGITTMLKEISQSTEELKIIDHGDLKILLEHGTNFFIALLVSDKMWIYKDKLVQLRRTIENYFGTVLQSWDGNLKYFEPLGIFIKNIF